ncbi:8-oxo-dGTP pyrophosphatase MutT (NUDIX family) [Azospirillum fermentarium]|uniref:NUDIX hydrolase n=1 Tax=Azospirillum fermentarium TaxID=1233114 RepID=UPI002227E844|nr:NUDIX hydrolase [Azospirillum fermentarium]MCW2247178.1 8-oxo-dGTP pyrophosphatase MutT (NUDIX family) [Azospirillum fermentarium]
MNAVKRQPRDQYAALPYRDIDGVRQVMLITSRDTGRWIIPKGWPEKRTKPHDMAAREAFEEAGLLGRVSSKPCGVYHYDKRMKSGKARACAVQVFLLAVEQELESWPEKGQRERRWMDPLEAASLVNEGDLADLLRAFAADAMPPLPQP